MDQLINQRNKKSLEIGKMNTHTLQTTSFQDKNQFLGKDYQNIENSSLAT